MPLRFAAVAMAGPVDESNGGGFASRGIRHGGLALVAAIAAAGFAPAPATAAADIERAYVRQSVGIARDLRDGTGSLRVRIVSRAQPLLRAAIAGRSRSLLRPSGNAAGPIPRLGAISPAEKAAARRAEAAYEDGIDQLSDEARAASRRLARIGRAVRRQRGTVQELELAPAAVIARVKAGSLQRLAGNPNVQAIEPAPAPRRLSGIGTAAVGAPSWWAAGFTGGGGRRTPCRPMPRSRARPPTQTHPAFAGVTVDNDPEPSGHRSRDPHRRDHRLR